MSDLTEKLRKLPTPVVLVIALAALGLTFAISAGWWWVAHHMAWWTYGLLSLAGVFARVAAGAVWKARSRRKARMSALNDLADRLLDARRRAGSAP